MFINQAYVLFLEAFSYWACEFYLWWLYQDVSILILCEEQCYNLNNFHNN